MRGFANRAGKYSLCFATSKTKFVSIYPICPTAIKFTNQMQTGFKSAREATITL
jgi:hypothetical protein